LRRAVLPAEMRLLRRLTLSETKFMVVGLTAAVMQGADAVTQDIDLWVSSAGKQGLARAAKEVGGIYAWRADPPFLDGPDLDRIDLVNHMDGLGSFDEEYRGAVDCQIDDFVVKLLPLERIIVSKRAAGRGKDVAALPALEAALISKRYL